MGDQNNIKQRVLELRKKAEGWTREELIQSTLDHYECWSQVSADAAIERATREQVIRVEFDRARNVLRDYSSSGVIQTGVANMLLQWIWPDLASWEQDNLRECPAAPDPCDCGGIGAVEATPSRDRLNALAQVARASFYKTSVQPLEPGLQDSDWLRVADAVYDAILQQQRDEGAIAGMQSADQALAQTSRATCQCEFPLMRSDEFCHNCGLVPEAYTQAGSADQTVDQTAAWHVLHDGSGPRPLLRHVPSSALRTDECGR